MSYDAHEFDHAVGANLDYGFNWGKNWLEIGEAITGSVWDAPTGIVKASEQSINGVTSVFLSGLVEGSVYRVTNTINTSNGRTDSRTLILSCKKRYVIS